jgi:AcrR family transcriptional regulator
VRQLVIAAAAELFSTQDYAGTSTREIAARAGVAESVLFRHFGSKANLLAEAVAEPFEQFLISFTATWEAHGRDATRDQEEIVHAFVADLYDNLVARRAVLRTLIGASGSADVNHVAEDVHRRLEGVFTTLQSIASDSARQRGADVRRAEIDVRAIVAMICSLAVLDDWFLPARRPARKRLLDDVTGLILNGLQR